MSLRRQERRSEAETILRWDAHKTTVSVFTASPVVKRKLERAGLTPSKRVMSRGRETGWFFVFPYTDLRWGARKRKTGPRRGGFGVQRPESGQVTP